MSEPVGGPPPEPPPQFTPRRHPLLDLFVVGAGIFFGLMAAGVCCLFGVGFVSGLHLPVSAFLVAAGLLFVAPLIILLRRRPESPFQLGLVIGLCLTGLIMGACGTLMR
jgi:hypothetical protein